MLSRVIPEYANRVDKHPMADGYAFAVLKHKDDMQYMNSRKN